MVLIYSTTPHDTDELVALRQVINDNERAFSDLRTIYSVDQRRLCDEYDALMAAQRPTYPTPEHLQGLDMVAEMMRRALAPYRARSSQHAWAFTEDDIEAFRDELNKRSLGIASHWQHEDGVASQVFNARV